MIEANERDRIIFGCGNFGGVGSSPALRDKGDDREQALRLLDHALRRGVTKFDTANTYGGGVSESVLGEWLRRQGKSFLSGVEIATKVGNPHGCPPGERPLSRAQVAEHLDRSLSRLGIEQISLYYLHEFDPSTPLEETLEAIERALASGKIAAFGVSNASVDDLWAVLNKTSGELRRAFKCVQNQFNLIWTQDQADVIPLARAEAIRYAAFSPLAGGLLSGKYREGRAAEPGTRLDSAPDYYAHLLTPGTFDAIANLRRHANERGWTVAGAALRFALDAPGVDHIVIAPRSAEQFDTCGIQPIT